MTIADKLLTVTNNTPAVIEKLNAAKSKSSGTSIRVDDVPNVEQQLQIQLKSKNLFVAEDMCATNNSIDTTYDDDVITTTFKSGTLYINKYRKVVYPAGTYTISVVPVSENVSLSIWLYDVDGVEKFVKAFSLISTTMSQTVTSDKDFAITFSGYGGSNGECYGTHSFKIQIERGSVATPYAPHVENFEVIELSKNLFNIDDRVVRDFGAISNSTQRTFTENSVYLNVSANNYCVAGHKVSYEKISDSSFTVLIPSTSQTGWTAYGAGFNFRVNPNTTYSVSASYDTAKGVIHGCGFYDENGNLLSFTTNSYNVTTPNDCAWMTVVFGVKLRDEAVLYENVQLEQNESVTEYAPYGMIPVGIKVTSYGKNLFNKLKYAIPPVGGGSKYYVDEDYITSFVTTRFEYVAVNITDLWYILEKLTGKKVTFSFDLRVDLPGKVTVYTLGKNLINFNYGSTKGNIDATTEWQHFSTTIPINSNTVNLNGSGNADNCSLSWYGTYDTGVKPYVRNLQIEISDAETDYEDYKEPRKAIANSSGKVLGLTSVAPSTTLITENNAIIDLEYFPQSSVDTYTKYKQLKAEMAILKDSL